jgi:hypothetical protein
MKEEYNHDDSMIAEAELELSMSKLWLTNYKNLQKLIKEIALSLCEVKYEIPVLRHNKRLFN